MDTAAGGDPEFERVRSLFERALDVPPAEREAWVRREAGALAERVLAMLQEAATGGTDALRAAVDPGRSGTAGERVQSTATGALFEKLKTAPKLDGERFVLEGELGQGGMGVVMKIHDRFLNRRLAMKVLLERRAPRDSEEQRLAHQLLGRFLEEAQVTSQLDHPGVVPVHELGLDAAGKVWFTMRMVKGRTASEVFADCYAKKGEWDLVRGLEVVLKVCDTMAYAHDKGVLHRDLKPSNVMVGRFGEVYVMDWGLAKVLGQQDRHDLRIRKEGTGASRIDSARKLDAADGGQNSVVTIDGQQLGTPSYMSPEQARSEEVDGRADVYSIGAMLYELVTGRAPYTVPGVREHAYYILKELTERPPQRIGEIRRGIPAEIVAITERAMARERAGRYPDVRGLAADLRAFLAHRVVQAYRTGPWEEAKLWFRHNKQLASLLLASLLGLIVANSLLVAVTITARDREQQANQLSTYNRQLATNLATQQGRLTAAIARFDYLKLVVSFERLLASASQFGPGSPEDQLEIDRWIADARHLIGQREDLQATVGSLRDKSTGGDMAPESATAFLANTLDGLIDRLPLLEERIPDVEQRRQWAREVAALTLHHPNAPVTWESARAAVAASPRYSGQDIPLRNQDIWGLVPIGENPQSGLWEFYDLRSAWDGTSDPTELAKHRIPKPGPDGRIEVTGDTGMIWVLLPGGTLPQGTVDEGSEGNACVRLGVRLDAFLMSKYETTRGQWSRWTHTDPESLQGHDALNYPVASISWSSANDNLAKVGLELPSELQWEFALRAGTATRWWTGNDEEHLTLAENAGRKQRQLLPVGRKYPNGFGLHDMAGNLWEWCFDVYGAYGTESAGNGRRTDPAPGQGTRCCRGGRFGFDASVAESSHRGGGSATDRLVNLGFRPVRPIRR